jgi:uncharacterized integral membrane protein
VANDDAGRNNRVSATEGQRPARAAGARKQGVVGRMTEQARETVEGIRLPRPDWRTFAWGLLLLILIGFIAGNWAPLRINFFGWYVDAPRAVVLAIFFALGMVTTWLIEIRHRRARDGEEREETNRESQAERAEVTETPIGELQPAADDFTDDPVFAEEMDAEVRREPEAFADEEFLVDDDLAAEDDRFETPVAGEDQTAGDALLEEYSPAEPGDTSFGDDSAADEDLDDEDAAPQESAGNDTEESSDEDDSRKPFWRK